MPFRPAAKMHVVNFTKLPRKITFTMSDNSTNDGMSDGREIEIQDDGRVSLPPASLPIKFPLTYAR